MTSADGDGRLARRLGLADAIIIGLGAMLGAGVFAAPAPAAAAAGRWLLAGLAIAAAVAYANATASARLAAVYPQAGGTAVYAREQLGPLWGFLAGWAFVVGKTASLAAMALTFGSYAWPSSSPGTSSGAARLIGIAAVIVLTAVNVRGVEKTARLTRAIVAVVVTVLALVIAAAWLGQPLRTPDLSVAVPGVRDVLQSAGLLFFAFAGYARLATLGEEVRDPQRTIPRAVLIALGIVVTVYAAVLAAALHVLGAQGLATATAPLAAVVEAGSWAAAAPVVRVGAAVASAGVLLSLLAGVSRTTLALARRSELPRWLDAVHPRYRTPYRAEIIAAAIVIAVVAVADVRGAIGFSSFAVLGYYALTNASAWSLNTRSSSRTLAAFGLIGCITLAFSLPATAVLGGAALLLAGLVAYGVRRRGSVG